MGAKTRFLVTVLAIGILAAVGWGAISFAGEARRATTQTVDVSGPCDEAEHANDPRCTGVLPLDEPTDEPTVEPTDTPSVEPTDDPGDISGPCDEAEHANDPRCTGVGTVEDNSGPGRGGDDDDDDDRSGSNSGSGSGEDRSGSNSGRG